MLEELKSKIYARLPELKELSMGCEVKNRHGDTCKIGNGRITDDTPYDTYAEGHYWFTIKEILGHPITPTHILRCLGSDYAMDGEGYIYPKIPPLPTKQPRYFSSYSFKLDLSNFSIDKLDDETIEFLLNNIK